MTPILQYAGLLLERADHLRRDAARLDEYFHSPACRIIPLLEERSLLRVNGNPATVAEAVWVSLPDLYGCLHPDSARVFLGLWDEAPVFAVHVEARDSRPLLTQWPDSRFIDLRNVGSLLDNASASLLAYARGLLYWQRHHGYCSRCGAPTTAVQGGHVMQCLNESCGRQSFPRLEPAVIMLVEREQADSRQVLLGRSHQWTHNVFSTLAGFVEPGETLEAAVAREVWEEAGIRVDMVQYQASQPWPFPASLMLGFRARALSHALHIDPQELAEARWFSAAELRTFGNWGDAGNGLKLPRADSIARFLIDSWLAEQQD
ncbi:MAG: NAD(+) diphosphatase [Thiothrix sp.]|nr:NAD(+) diphosphatase [Thiothrix sp.]HPQ96184.1 NAD(+) diphosphatase [Thiolinea sp.]